MPTFRYKAISQDGAKVSGVVDAYDRYEAVSQVKQTCSVVISMEKVPALPNTGIDLFASRPVGDKQLSMVSSQFSIILKTGMPLIRAVELICQQTSDKKLRGILEEVSKDVAAGYSLADSFQNKGGRVLPTTFIETVRAGEESGTLVASFEKLKLYYEKSANIRSKVTSAMMYPAFLLALAAVVIAIIMVFTMPVFTSMFEQLDIELPALTKAIIAVANFFSAWWWLVLMLLTSAIIAFQLYIQSEQGCLKWHKVLLKLPALGLMNRMKGASQFANTMSTLLTAGLPLIRCTEIVSRVLDNRHLGRQLSLLVPQLEEGKALGGLLEKSGIFPPMLCEMTAMGEDTGSMEETLATIGEYYDKETETASQRAISMLQPAITVVMGIIIGLIVIGLYLPMFTMYEGL